MRLLVGLDSHEGGRDALELARVLAGREKGEVLVVSVLFDGPLPLEFALLSDAESQEARPLIEQAHETLRGLDVEVRVYGGGSPAAILTTLAEQEEFEAIVVGSPHRGAVGRVLVGSTALSLLDGAPADVAVAPRGFANERHEGLRRIAVGYDGTPESKVALEHAEALARSAKAGLQILTVVREVARAPVATPVVVPNLAYFPPDPEQVMSEARESVDPALSAESTRRDGEPVREIVRACEEGIDLLVVGSRGYGPVTRVLLGSVSRELVRKASCPVLVARRP